jgi:hypothetical protein
MDEEHEDGERIGPTTEDVVGTEGDTESLLDAPSRVGGCGTTRSDAGFDGCADKAKVRAKFVTVPAGFANETSCRWVDSGNGCRQRTAVCPWVADAAVAEGGERGSRVTSVSAINSLRSQGWWSRCRLSAVDSTYQTPPVPVPAASTAPR